MYIPLEYCFSFLPFFKYEKQLLIQATKLITRLQSRGRLRFAELHRSFFLERDYYPFSMHRSTTIRFLLNYVKRSRNIIPMSHFLPIMSLPVVLQSYSLFQAYHNSSENVVASSKFFKISRNLPFPFSFFKRNLFCQIFLIYPLKISLFERIRIFLFEKNLSYFP